MAFRIPDLAGLLSRIGNANAKGEYYLTDAIALAGKDGLITRPVVCSEEEAMGVNSRAQLAGAEAVFQRRARARAMQAGATLTAPDTVWFSFDTKIGRDVTIEPNVFFGPGVVVEDGVEILANCHMEGVRIRKGARVGPFARLRPGADIGVGAHVGNFVEVKNARLEEGAKANHLAYIGDGRVAKAPTSAPVPSSATTTASTSSSRTSAGRVRRLQLVAGGAGQDRRWRLHRLGQRDHQERRARRPGARAVGAGAAAGLGAKFRTMMGRRKKSR
jgi:bifunctional UDP-N-acetylglucosamine pyrophosphorylase/glucosamine-1-phosphate N-acetyltransferase